MSTIPVIEQSELEVTELLPYEETDDPNIKAHIINPLMNKHIWNGDPNMMAQDIVDIARATGQIVMALCGVKFVPKHNPDKPDACSSCLDIASMLITDVGY